MDDKRETFADDEVTAGSESRSGEEIARGEHEPGRTDTGGQGATDRPTGTSTARDFTGVDPQDPITRDEDQVVG